MGRVFAAGSLKQRKHYHRGIAGKMCSIALIKVGKWDLYNRWFPEIKADVV